jgi:hypothetical protein
VNLYAFVPLKKEKRRSFEHFIVSPRTPSNFEFTMSQDPTSQAPPEVKQEDPATINVKVRVSFESKGGWDRDVALNVGAMNLGRLGPGRGGILQDQTHNEAFQAPGCVCEQGRKGCWQHQVRGVSSIKRIKFVIFIFFSSSPRVAVHVGWG